MKIKSILQTLLLVFGILSLLGCSDSGGGNDENNEEATITIKSISPAAESIITTGDTITAELEYEIINYKDDADYKIDIWFLKTDGLHHITGDKTYQNIYKSSGSVTFVFNVNSMILSDSETKKPYEVSFSVTKIIDEFNGKIISFSDNVIYNEDNINVYKKDNLKMIGKFITDGIDVFWEHRL